MNLFDSKKVLKSLATVTLAASASLVTGCGSSSSDDPVIPKDILTIVALDSNFSTLTALVKLCKLESALTAAPKRTLFAPTNAAFKASLGDALPTSCANDVASILKYHLVASEVKSTAAKPAETAVATLGGDIFLKKSGSSVVINNSAKVTAADKVASNGIIHTIDKVLIPDAAGTVVDIAAKRDTFSTLVKLVTLCELGGALSAQAATLTVFAPTNDAFAAYVGAGGLPTTCPAALKNTLLYHVLGSKVKSTDLAATQSPATLLVPGKIFVTKSDAGVVVNGGSKVVAADVMSAKGVVHVIDKVLVPDEQGTIVAALQKRFDSTSLVSSVVKAGLVETLSGTGPFTVFAPSNAAFTAIASTTANLTVAQLTKVLTHHVVSGKKLAAEIVGAGATSTLATVETSSIAVSLSAAPVTVILKGSSQSAQTNEAAAKVTETDIVASNGVIHLVSGVLIPAGL